MIFASAPYSIRFQTFGDELVQNWKREKPPPADRSGEQQAIGEVGGHPHPAPAFLYTELAGPLLDIGPYAVATVVELIGPVRRVTGLATRTRDEGVIGTGPSAGTAFPIVEPTRVGAVLEHETGVLTTVTTTVDADGPARHGVEIHGSAGALLGGDPNGFGGPVILRRRDRPDEPLELVSEWRDNACGLGLQDLCRAVSAGMPQRVGGALGLHVVEVLLAIRDSARDGAAIAIAQQP